MFLTVTHLLDHFGTVLDTGKKTAVGLKKGEMGGVGVGLRAVGLKIGDKGGGRSEERWKQKSCSASYCGWEQMCNL